MMSLYDQLQEKLEGRPYNGYFACLCQFHDDHSPSMFVYEDTGTYSCKSCGAHGTLVKLDRHLGGRSVKIATSKPQVLPQWRKWEEQYGDLEGIATHAHLSCKRYPQWMFYFKERKIDQFYEQGRFGFIDNWCFFPVIDENKKVISAVMRYTGKHKDTRYVTRQSIDGKQYLYIPNRSRVSSSDYVVVCYGIVDAWSFEDIGIPVITGCTGKFSSPELLRELHKKIYIIPDRGEEKDAHLLANSLGWRGRVINLPYPDGCKDSDDVRIQYGKDFLKSMVMEHINE